MKNLIMLFIAVGALAVGLCAQTMAAEDEQPKTVTIGDQDYTVIPDEEVRGLGFELPDVEPEDNAANDYINAISAYHGLERRSPLEDLRDEVIQNGWTDEAGPLAGYVEDNEAALESIRAAAGKKVCRFPMLLSKGSTLDEVSPAGVLLPHLSKLRELARFLIVAGKAYEYEGDLGEALDTYMLCLQLGNHVAQEPILISGLVGVACDLMGARAIEQCLVNSKVDDATLAKAQKRLAALAQGRPNAAVTMRGESAWSTSIVEYMIKHPKWLNEYIEADSGTSKLQHAAFVAMLHTEAGRERIRTDVHEFWDAMNKAMELPLPMFIETGAGDEPVNTARARKTPPNIMAVLGPAFGRVRMQFAKSDLAYTVLDVEFALARYRAAHDAYPESLDAVKDLMLGDGIDPYSGKRLKYRVEDDGSYTIWSVGQNLVDDGGAVGATCPDWKADDYVWNSEVISGN